jgi:hypothetical protein
MVLRNDTWQGIALGKRFQFSPCCVALAILGAGVQGSKGRCCCDTKHGGGQPRVVTWGGRTGAAPAKGT